jgi:hypothetical protein
MSSKLLSRRFNTEKMSGQLQNDIAGSLDPLNWFLLFLGWFMYWLKLLDKERRKDTRSFFSAPLRDFLVANIFEIPISFLSCIVAAIISPEVPHYLIDMSGRLAVFGIGYMSSSILNSIMSYRKPVA